MSDCAPITDLLLEADPAELRGVGETEVARHVRTCARCAEAAETILGATARLDEALATTRAAVDVDALLRRAESERQQAGPVEKRTRVLRLPGWRRWGALAAAASVAALLLARSGEPPAPAGARIAVPQPALEVAEGDNVAVIPTNDPDITVLWFF